MVIYTENLYQNIFEKYADKFTHLRVISGYGSSKFLKKVIEEFSDLNVQLFLGMTAEGVSIENHNKYLLACRQSERIKVYYQISGVLNHIKLLEFSNEFEKKLLVGSANFTENGFIHQKELMTEIEESLDFLFEEQISKSLACTEQNIADFINFYTENAKSLKQQKELEDDRINNLEDLIKVTSNSMLTATIQDSSNIYYNKLILLRKRIDSNYYRKFELPIVLPSSSNHRWASTGINAWTEQRKSVLEQNSKLLFKNIFPEDKEFKIYTDDDLIFFAKLSGKFNRQLELLNGDFYQYMRGRLNIEDNRPICYEDLVSRNQTKVFFERINVSEFYMSFNEI